MGTSIMETNGRNLWCCCQAHANKPASSAFIVSATLKNLSSSHAATSSFCSFVPPQPPPHRLFLSSRTLFPCHRLFFLLPVLPLCHSYILISSLLLPSPLVFFPFHPPIRAATQCTLPSRLLLRASASGIPLCDYLQSSDTIQVMQGLVQTAPCGRVKGIGSAVLCTAYLQIPCRY